MVSVIEISYNPFVPRLNILIDGESPSEYSELIQYADEDIYKWCFLIFDSLYSEIRSDFAIVFTGTKSDAEILKAAAKKNQYCKGFKHIEFPIDTPVNQRLISLQKYIAEKKVSSYVINKIGYNLIIENGLSVDSEILKSKMQIKNRFCEVIEDTPGCSSRYNIIISSSVSNAKQLLLDADNSVDYSFIIVLSNESSLVDLEKNSAIYTSTKEALVQTVFKCWLSFPLTIALRNTYNSIKPEHLDVDLQMSVAVDAVITISCKNTVELGGTVPLSINAIPETSPLPKLVFRPLNNSIVSCNGMYIAGKAIGRTKIDVYKYGDSLPFDTLDVNVIRRNRIKDLFLSEERILLGKGDNTTLSVDYSPVDADNANTIEWKSTDESVVRVVNGRIKTVGVGCCRIICTAENVSAQCICTVKEYLQDIMITPEFENGEVLLMPMDEIQLSVTAIPNDAIDGELYIKSSDTDIVNHVGTTLVAKNSGTASIQIYNKSNSVVKTIKVTVEAVQKHLTFVQKLKKFIGVD